VRTNPIAFENALREIADLPLLDLRSSESLYEARQELFMPNLPVYYKPEPLKIVKGAFHYFYDEKGQTYIDTVNNVATVGHCHPRLTEAASNQISYLNTNTRFMNENMVKLAHEVQSIMTVDKLKMCYFVNSGSEATDLSLRLARNFTGRDTVITMENSYHGHT
jgi:4-aminobutyrate aminotransferase-like enzyme